MIAGDGRLAAEIKAESVHTNLRDLQEYSNALGALLRNGKTDPRAVHLPATMPLHSLGMISDVFGAQTAAE